MRMKLARAFDQRENGEHFYMRKRCLSLAQCGISK